jgi:hypothetical protein
LITDLQDRTQSKAFPHFLQIKAADHAIIYNDAARGPNKEGKWVKRQYTTLNDQLSPYEADDRLGGALANDATSKAGAHARGVVAWTRRSGAMANHIMSSFSFR